jgi:hypothetical protein
VRTSLRLLRGLLVLALGAGVFAAWPGGAPTPLAIGAPTPTARPASEPSPVVDATLADAAGVGPGDAATDASTAGAPTGPSTGPEASSPPPSDGGLLRSLAPVRVPHPDVPPGPRRIGLQAGHWLTSEVPEELHRLEHSTGTSGGGVMEWEVNLDVARRAAALLRAQGYQVDVLPTTLPPGYLADVFLALHADGSNDPATRGYKAAHGSRRGPYEDQLVQTVMEEYGRATGLPTDPSISRNMRGYYAFSWSRQQYSVAPHTPAAILEMGFMTNAADRSLLVGRPDVVASAVARGVLRFLDEVPAGAPFADDLILPPAIPFRPTPTAR